MSILTFLKVATKDVRVAALAPSSSFVKNRLVALLPHDMKTVLEYGPGDGVLTHVLLEKLPKDGKLLVIETNPDFIAMLRKINDPRLIVVHGDAREAARIAREHGITTFDVAVSGIPFTHFSSADRAALSASTAEMLRPGGVFLVYQFSLLMRKYLAPHFAVRAHFEPRNFPPYFIMAATRRVAQR